MAVKIYNASAGAFKDAPTPQIYDASTQAYKDSTGLVYDTSKGAWDERWGGLANGVLYDRGKENKKYYNSLELFGEAIASVNSGTIVNYRKDQDKLWINYMYSGNYRNNTETVVKFDGASSLSIELVNKLLDEGFVNLNIYGRIKMTTGNTNNSFFRVHNGVTYKDVVTPFNTPSDDYYTATNNLVRDKIAWICFTCGNYYPIDATAEIYKIWASK